MYYMGLENLLQMTASAEKRSLGKRDAKKARGARPSTWMIYWQDSMATYYPEATIGYTTTDAANLKKAIARGLPANDIGPMIEWAVKNWEKLRLAVSFGKRPTGPAIPDMKFLVWAINHAHAGYVAERDAATLDLSKRRESLREPVETPTAPKPRPLRQLPRPVNLTAPTPPPPRTLAPRSADEVEATRQRLGLPKWGNGK